MVKQASLRGFCFCFYWVCFGFKKASCYVTQVVLGLTFCSCLSPLSARITGMYQSAWLSSEGEPYKVLQSSIDTDIRGTRIRGLCVSINV
jgi:hypothetical protein